MVLKLNDMQCDQITCEHSSNARFKPDDGAHGNIAVFHYSRANASNVCYAAMESLKGKHHAKIVMAPVPRLIDCLLALRWLNVLFEGAPETHKCFLSDAMLTPCGGVERLSQSLRLLCAVSKCHQGISSVPRESARTLTSCRLP